jgi:hypothetical protein
VNLICDVIVTTALSLSVGAHRGGNSPTARLSFEARPISGMIMLFQDLGLTGGDVRFEVSD